MKKSSDTLSRPVEKRTPHGCFINFKDVVLRYPVGPYVKGSLKTAIFSLLGHRSIDRAIPREYFTALDGINVTIEHGERVGIIGHNGAGKSTTLQTIAGIYAIASGTLTVQGKIQGLFNLGLGFEADATGRENITYRGLAMGCPPEEIAQRQQDIIEFADIGEFIDFPVRTYSSGMYVRLAFAISTYLEGDILLIDEVFSAGDAAFQKRAKERFHSLVQKAGIVVMVSHDMDLVQKVCTRALWIDHGHIRADGDAASVIAQYQATNAG